jgi:hypothetical protein
VANADAQAGAPNTGPAASSTMLAAQAVGQRAGDERPGRQAEQRGADSTGASAGLPTPHSFSSDGAMKPMAAVSKPSSRTMKKHVANTSHWYREKR